MLPDFLILGAPRSATTSLHYYLSQHPSIAMSLSKEPNYFLFDPFGHPLVGEPRIITKSVSSRDAYERQFPSVNPGVVGEASPLYLYTERSPELIAGALPQARLIATVREPIERAFSHFRYVYPSLGDRTPAAFADAVTAELPLPDQPYRMGTHSLRLGRYAAQLQRYLDYFPADQLLVLRFDDIQTNPSGALASVCRLLGVDESWQFDVGRTWARSGGSPTAIDRMLAPVRPYVKRALPPRLTGALAKARATRQSGPATSTQLPTSAEARSRSTLPLPDELCAAVEDYFAESNETLAKKWAITF